MYDWTDSEWEGFLRDNPVSDSEFDPTGLEEPLVDYSEEESGMEGQGDPGQGPSNVQHAPEERLEQNDPPEIPGIGPMALDNVPQRHDAGNPLHTPEGNVNAEADPPRQPEGEIEPIWEGASDGMENVARRTPIVVTPGVAHYTTRQEPDTQRVVNWRHRGLQEMEFTPQQLNRMRQLKLCTMEFAAISGNKYIPPGFAVDDLLRLYTADRPEVLTEHDLHLRTMAAEILQLKGQMRMKEQTFAGMFARIDAIEDSLRENQEVMANWELEEGECAQQNPPAEALQGTEGQQAGSAELPQPAATLQAAAAMAGPPAVAMAVDRPDNQEQTGWPQVAPGPAAPSMGTGSTVAHMSQLNFMKKLATFEGNRPAHGHQQRNWPEWKAEFIQNAVMVQLPEESYYAMALSLLSQPMRDVWLAYLAICPQENSWTFLDNYMGIHYAAMDKSAEAEKRFERARLHVSTEKAWQAYANAQAAHIAEMGASIDRTKTDKGLWNMFLANITVPEVHSQAFHTYMAEKAAYDALPVQARITKLTPVILTYVQSVSADTGPSAQGAAQRRGTGTASSQTNNRSREKRRADTTPVQPAHRQRTERAARPNRSQAESSKMYHAVPADQDAKTCPDVGFQDNTEPRPYNHSLREKLQAENRCLVCWSHEHRIQHCPERSEELKAEMDRKWYAPPPPACEMPELECKQLEISKDESAALETEAAQEKEASIKMVASTAQEADLTNTHTGLRTARAEVVEPSGDTRPTEVGEEDEQYNAAQQAGISSGQYKQTVCNASAKPMNENSSPAENHNLLMMGTGKTKLASAHYVFDPTELECIANETRPFTRDGFAKGSTYRHPGCSKDACYLPEKPFECSDHRGHHCWMDPPVKNIEMALQSYAAAKQYDPSNTSMCILVPVWRKTVWWKQLRKLKRIRIYPKGAEKMISEFDQHRRIQLPYRSAVFYDTPSAPVVLGSISNQQAGIQHHMTFEAEITGKKVNVLLDTGASQSFISKEFCQKADMKSVAAPTPQQVRTAGGTDIMTQTLCQVSFQLQGMGITVSPLVVPLPDDFAVILGDDWLREKEAILNYQDQTCSLKKNERGKRHILHKAKEKPHNGKRFKPDLLTVRMVEDEQDMTAIAPADFSKVPIAYRELLEEYKDVFPSDLPPGLPPRRPGVDLVIPF